MMFGLGGDQIDEAMLRRIEAKLDLVLDHLGLKFEGTPVSAEARELAASGKLIEAIKVHREQTGASLADAKRAVEEAARN